MLLYKISKEEKIESSKVLKKDIAKLPPNMAKLLKKLLGDVTNDSEIKVDDTAPDYLTPNEAASYLQVSRPYVMKLIKDEVLSSHKIGAHNKVHLKDVVALKNSWSNQTKSKSEKLQKGVDRFIQDEGWDD
ncbi:MAG: helix-turn-helix domain-containing protein [Bdellovibrionales bacterium]|nr:helix-turn-helix domain-containing protein [Bdellovibrionales bacterium]